MDIERFTFTDGLMVSLFGIVIVFLILVLLQLVLILFRFLPKTRKPDGMQKEAPSPERDPGTERKNPEGASSGSAPDEDDEDALVAMLTAAILAREHSGGDIRIKSIRRISEEG